MRKYSAPQITYAQRSISDQLDSKKMPMPADAWLARVARYSSHLRAVRVIAATAG